MKSITTGVALCALMAGTFVGTAATAEVSAANPGSVVGALAAKGYRASLETDSEGDPVIRSSTAGVNFNVYFYGCTSTGSSCETVQFSAGFDKTNPLTSASMNDWNRRKRYAKANIDDEGDPYLRMDIMMGPNGLPDAVFEKTLDMWDRQLGAFLDHIDW